VIIFNVYKKLGITPEIAHFEPNTVETFGQADESFKGLLVRPKEIR